MIARSWAVTLIGAVACGLLASAQPTTKTGPTFGWVDVYIDSREVPLAAYQLKLTATVGRFQIVGLEGGEHPAFRQPPYYDPAALANDRVIVAAFSTDEDLPTHRTRVARVHVSLEGELPTYAATLMVAATADGSRIPVDVQAEPGEES